MASNESGVNLAQLDEIKEICGLRVEMLPPWVIGLNIEVVTHHPALSKELNRALKEDNMEPETFYGVIAAYCGLVLEGAYNQQYLAESLTKALVDKRDGICVITDPNITVVPKDLLQ